MTTWWPVAAVAFCCASTLCAQDPLPPLDAAHALAEPALIAPYDRPVSLLRLMPNLAVDQKDIWLFPVHAARKRNWKPVVAIAAMTAALIAVDPADAPVFHRNTLFNPFNRVFSGRNTSLAIYAAPLSLLAMGLVRSDSKMKSTALLAGEAVAGAEILTTIMKSTSRRVRPVTLDPHGDYSDTWFRDQKRFLRANGSFPSGHTIAAFSVATIIARRYGNHHWVPFAAYGAATLIGFSRLTLLAHFPSDVFLGGALGYSIARFAVLRQ